MSGALAAASGAWFPRAAGSSAWRGEVLRALKKNKGVYEAKYVQLATLEQGAPRCRTVVFRGFLEAPSEPGAAAAPTEVLEFITDTRSAKVCQRGAPDRQQARNSTGRQGRARHLGLWRRSADSMQCQDAPRGASPRGRNPARCGGLPRARHEAVACGRTDDARALGGCARGAAPRLGPWPKSGRLQVHSAPRRHAQSEETPWWPDSVC